MKLLAIRMARFGDIVLLLPALCRMKASLSITHLTFLTGHRCAPLAAMCPAIDDVMGVDRIRMRDGPRFRAIVDIAGLVRDVRRREFDWVVDCHGLRETNLLTWLSGSPRRLGFKRFDQSYSSFCFNMPPVLEDKNIHVSEMFMRIADRVAPDVAATNPSITIPTDDRAWVREVLPRPFVAMYIDAPVAERLWPPEKFAAVADHVAREWNKDVAILSGPGRPDLVARARRVAHHADRLHLFSNLTVPQLAAVIGGSDFLISNDTGPMHLGPALGVQTLAIFSVGIPRHFRPTGPRDAFVQGVPIEGITVEEVIQKMETIR